MTAQLIDGKYQASQLMEKIAAGTQKFLVAIGRKPTLAMVLVGENPASQVYVRSKENRAVENGFASQSYKLAQSTTQDDLLELINTLNNDDTVDGILVQLPLPQHIDSDAILVAIDPTKDVDGFHPYNTGLLFQGKPFLVPCTPLGCVHLLKSVVSQVAGLNALVIGRSNIVGRPLASLLLAENCTVTLAHSRSRNLPELAHNSDAVFVAVGKPRLVQPTWIRSGAVVIDVGIHRMRDEHGEHYLTGDVDPSLRKKAGFLTPVPGGVGPMTIAYLLQNTLLAANTRLAISSVNTLS